MVLDDFLSKSLSYVFCRIENASANRTPYGFHCWPIALILYYVYYLICCIPEVGFTIFPLVLNFICVYIGRVLPLYDMVNCYNVDLHFTYFMNTFVLVTCCTEWLNQRCYEITVDHLQFPLCWDYICDPFGPLIAHNGFHCYPLGLLLCYDKSLITFISHDVFRGHLLTLSMLLYVYVGEFFALPCLPIILWNTI